MTCQNQFCQNEFEDNYYVFFGRLVCPECYAKLIQGASRCAFCDSPIPHRPYHSMDKNFCNHRCCANWFLAQTASKAYMIKLLEEAV